MNLRKTKLQGLIAALAIAGMSLACEEATAMAKRQVVAEAASAAPATLPVTVGDYAQGYQLGQRNGSLMADRLKQRTVGLGGCPALGDYERALVQVTKAIRPPVAGADKEVVRGYFRGYLDAVRTAIREARLGCDAVLFEDGALPGDLYGALFCQIVSVDVDVLSTLETVPLYDGWAGEASQVDARVVDECAQSARITIQQCASSVPDLDPVIEVYVNAGCRG